MRLPILCFLIISVTLPVCLAQSQGDLPLGDVARLYRKEKKAPEHTVIDNENLTEFMDEIQSRKFTGSLLFSFDSAGKNFKVSSPDVTCSLSFNGQSSSLLSDPYVSRDLPGSELAKLDGPAVIQGKTLQVSVYNGSDWKIKELTVGLTLVRRQVPYGPARLQPAAEKTIESAEKLSDRTVLYHLKGMAAPNATTLFTEDLTDEPGPNQEWRWAIVGAKGIPPLALPEASSLTAPVAPPEASTSVEPSAEPAPATPPGPQ
jgi:hypothetical protein